MAGVIEPVQVLGQPAMCMRNADGAQATVLLHGAHIVSWIPAGGVEQLYLSPLAQAGAGQAVRGGIPIVFPQFEQRGPLPRHGLARNRAWQWVEGVRRGGAAIAVLRLLADEHTRAHWPHDFEAELTLSIVGARLDVELAISNQGTEAFEFTAALHTYLRCEDVQKTRLSGLYGARYVDSLTGLEQRQEYDAIGFAGEIDRIYFDSGEALSLHSPVGRVSLEAEGWPDVVVWNPGPIKAAAMADLPNADWQRLLCLEAAAIGRPVRLAAGEDWAARQGLQAD